MSERHDELLELCAAYALGNLDARDRTRLDAHLAEGCPECEEALADFSSTTVALAASLPASMPSPALRERVLDAVRGAESGTPVAERPARVIEMPRRRLWRWTLGFAAAAAALAVTTVWLGREALRLRTEVDILRGRVATLQSELNEQILWTSVLTSGEARFTTLTPTPAADPTLRGRATFDPDSRRAVVVLENVRPPAGRDYELWAIRGAVPVSLGVLTPDDEGRVVLRLRDLGDPDTLNAFAVSLEPKGGSPNKAQPSGPVVMVGALES